MPKSVAAVDGNNNGVVFKVGQRVRIHPASDWFMRGVTYGRITSLGLLTAYVQPENIGPIRTRARILFTLLTVAEHQ